MNAPTPTIREVHPRERAQGIALKLSPFVEFSMRTVDVIEAGIREDRRARTSLESIPADGGTVNPLEWDNAGEVHALGLHYAVSPYQGEPGNKRTFSAVLCRGGSFAVSCETQDEAKAAAQADFERRVLSCLSTHTATGAGSVGEADADAGLVALSDPASEGETTFCEVDHCRVAGDCYAKAVGMPEYCQRTDRNDYLSDAQARDLFGTEDDEALPDGRVRVCDGEWVRIPGGYYFDKSAGLLHPETANDDACDDCAVSITYPVEAPGEVELLTRKCEEWQRAFLSIFRGAARLRSKIITAETALSDTRTALRQSQRALMSLPGPQSLEVAYCIATNRAALTGDAQEAGR